MTLSRITGNSAPTGSGLFRATTAGTATAENNWWGCDDFPGAAGCDTVSGTADVDPRLALVVTATPSTIAEGGTSSVTADFSKNSANTSVSPVVLQGLNIDFAATYGTISDASVLPTFMATSTYTNTSCPSTPPEMVMATLDNGTDAADVTITCATTTTTTTSTTTTTTEPPPTTTTSTTTTTTEPPPTTTTTTTTTMPPPVTCNGFGPTTGCTVNGVRNQVCRGTLGTDTITGTSGADVIVGLGGNDTINGGNNDDRICGGDGTDTLNGDNGNDRLFGQNNNDTLNGNNGNDALDGGPQTDTCNGGNGSDTAASCESLTGVP